MFESISGRDGFEVLTGELKLNGGRSINLGHGMNELMVDGKRIESQEQLVSLLEKQRIEHLFAQLERVQGMTEHTETQIAAVLSPAATSESDCEICENPKKMVEAVNKVAKNKATRSGANNATASQTTNAKKATATKTVAKKTTAKKAKAKTTTSKKTTVKKATAKNATAKKARTTAKKTITKKTTAKISRGQ
jgi:outer membrane biosynthesis protein TonB